MENLGNMFGEAFKAVMSLNFVVIIDDIKHVWNLTELSQYCLVNNKDIENITINIKG